MMPGRGPAEWHGVFFDDDMGGLREGLRHTSDRSPISTSLCRSARQGGYIPDLCDLLVARVAGWEPYNLHDHLAHVSWVGSVLFRSCTTSQKNRLGSTIRGTLSTVVDRDLPNAWKDFLGLK